MTREGGGECALIEFAQGRDREEESDDHSAQPMMGGCIVRFASSRVWGGGGGGDRLAKAPTGRTMAPATGSIPERRLQQVIISLGRSAEGTKDVYLIRTGNPGLTYGTVPCGTRAHTGVRQRPLDRRLDAGTPYRPSTRGRCRRRRTSVSLGHLDRGRGRPKVAGGEGCPARDPILTLCITVEASD